MNKGRICPECGVYIRDWVRHKRGYRYRDKSGKILYGTRCRLQHTRQKLKEKGKFGGLRERARSDGT